MLTEFRTEKDAKLLWRLAGVLAISMELMAAGHVIGSIRHHEFDWTGIPLVIIAAIPWFAARRLLERFEPAIDQSLPNNARTDFSARLASLVIGAYAMCMVAFPLAS